MSIADRIRIMLGKLTPGEIAERDASARLRREAVERQNAEAEADRQARKSQEAAAVQVNRQLLAQHGPRLELAAGVSRLIIVCHKDTWSWLVKWMGQDTYVGWDQGAAQISERPEQVVEVRLSGQKVVEVLNRLALVRRLPGIPRQAWVSTPSSNDHPVAVRMYDAIAAVVDQVDPGNPSGKLPPVVLDDRPAATPVEDEGS